MVLTISYTIGNEVKTYLNGVLQKPDEVTEVQHAQLEIKYGGIILCAQQQKRATPEY